MATSKLDDMPLTFPDVEQYFKRLNFHLTANNKLNVSKAVLLSTCGQQAFSLIETLIAPADVTDDEVTFDIIRGAVLNHLRPKQILHYERHQLHTMIQLSDNISSFLQRLKKQANNCNFGALRDDLILSQFIFGLSDSSTRTKLLSTADLTLDNAVQIAMLSETVMMASTVADTVAAISTQSQYKKDVTPRYSAQMSKPGFKCNSCGSEQHRRSECKFRNATCFKCNKQGHISKVCRSNTTNFLTNTSNTSTDSNGHGIMSDANNEGVVLALTGKSTKLWWENCIVGKTDVPFLIDTGSQVSILPLTLAENTGFPISPAPSQALLAYDGGKVDIKGEIHEATIQFGENIHTGSILVTANGFKAILGMDFLPSLQLVKECAPLSQENSTFIASFRLKKDSATDGMCFAARSLPFSMKSMVETELKRLLAADIIFPVENPVVSAPIVPVVKQAGAARPIRICGDYSTTLNRIIDRDSYTLPRLEEILNKITGAKYYSVLDLEDAYLQITLDKQSQLLTCISTHIGHFAFNKMQFGISAAPLIFQEAIDKVLADISYVAAYQDDIIIGAPTKELHDITLSKVKQRLAHYHFKLNARKCNENQNEVKFLGYVLRDGKLLPDPKRIEAFEKIPQPTNKDQLRSLLGTLRHYDQFCINFSSIAKPLYSLLKKDSHWKWSTIHSRALASLLSTIPKGSLVCYDQSKELFVSCDASKDGLGYLLSHDAEQKQVVWTGSRVLSPAENNYSNIEREALAIVEAVKHFHHFIAGRKFTIMTDHAPLKYIFGPKKTSDRISARLQRWAITLKAYEYDVQYVKGENVFLADTLSRLPSKSTTLVPVVNMLEINSLQEFPHSSLLKEIANSSDAEILLLKRYVTNGWPRYASSKLTAYSQAILEYTIQGCVVYRGCRIVVPKPLRRRVLELLHENHPGIVRMIRLARQYFWWPHIDQSINAFVQQCSACQINARKRTNASLKTWEEPTSFMERVHIDVAHYRDKNYLVFIDAFSKWIDVQPLSSLSSESAIVALRTIIKYVGLPVSLVSDNGTNFDSQEFESFLVDNFIRHIRSPPGHHQSNGLAERFVQEIKFHLEKSKAQTNSEINLSLVSFCLHHNTSPSGNNSVPVDFIFQQRIRTRLSVQATERDTPQQAIPAYVRRENHKPELSIIYNKVGNNTFLDGKKRLVHLSDIKPSISPPNSELQVCESNEPSLTPQTSNSPTPLRRSQRECHAPERFGYE